jgi:hypothetical protein
VVNKAAVKYAPGFVSTMMNLPVVGQFTTSLLPMGFGALMGMFSEKVPAKYREMYEQMAKGIIGASLAGMGSAVSQVVTKPLGLEGVDLTPISYSGVDLTPMGQEESAADFGGVDLTPMGGEESPADFGGWGQEDDDYGCDEDSFGFEESGADFGNELDMSEDFY